MISEEILKRVMPGLSAQKRAAYLPSLQAAMQEHEIDKPLREAAFLAQIAHESGELRYMEEIWGPTDAQKRYEPPTTLSAKLGNTQAGDGRKYKGRCPIQITGRANYQKYGEALELDLVGDPELAARPEAGFRIAGLFWKRNGLNELADLQDFELITRRINGGLNGLEDRLKYYDRAKEVLEIPVTRRSKTMHVDDGSDLPRVEFTRGRETIDAETPPEEQRQGRRRRSAGTAQRGRARGKPRHKVTARQKNAHKTKAHRVGQRGKSRVAKKHVR